MAVTYLDVVNAQYKIRREWGFTVKEEAGKSKLEVGKGLMAIIAQDEKVTRFGVSDGGYDGFCFFSGSSLCGGHWFKDSMDNNTLQAWIGEYAVSISIGARYEKYAPRDSKGTWSKMRVEVYPANGSGLPLEEITLVTRIREYLDGYKPLSKAEGDILAGHTHITA